MPGLLPFVRRWFAETFSEPTRPQREGWEAIASGRDTLIVAPTGSGKTLAAFLWALDHLYRLGLEGRLEDRVYVVYVSPLRALNNDIEKNLRAPLAGIQAAAAADGTKLPQVRVAVLTGATARDPVVVDIGFARELDLRVVAPVDDFLTATSDTIWDATLQLVAELVQTHRTTLVFAQSRRAAERIARDLNDRIADGRVAAHHGSLSRRARLEAENRLKEGELRALVATSSLELGIDVGAIDLVVQLQSPRNIAAALQRVGRAGHLLSRVSKGRIVVTRGEELGEAAAVVRSIRARELDRTVMPEAPLDVLAQQIVAAVAAEAVGVDTLWQRFRNAAPYRTPPTEDFGAGVRALAEPLPAEVKGAAPRILWDRVNDRLHARRGSRFLALTSGGTIPDSGLFAVFVAETDLKVGTLDEGFGSERLPGVVFLLGSHAWKIVKVRSDRVLVEDAQGMSPTIPFWKGEHPSRSWELGLAVGRLRRDAPERLVTLVTPEEVDFLLGHALIGTPLFATRFRHCAIRALFIPRMSRGQRTPAYLQRLKADALLESVGGQAEFPVVAETLRECFNNALDVTRLKRLLERLHDGEMWRRHVDTPLPSPFVYPLLLAWDWAYLGAGHAEERRSDAVTMRKAWSVAPGPLRPEIVATVEADLQKTTHERRARDANELAGNLRRLGDLTPPGV